MIIGREGGRDGEDGKNVLEFLVLVEETSKYSEIILSDIEFVVMQKYDGRSRSMEMRIHSFWMMRNMFGSESGETKKRRIKSMKMNEMEMHIFILIFSSPLSSSSYFLRERRRKLLHIFVLSLLSLSLLNLMNFSPLYFLSLFGSWLPSADVINEPLVSYPRIPVLLLSSVTDKSHSLLSLFSSRPLKLLISSFVSVDPIQIWEGIFKLNIMQSLFGISFFVRIWISSSMRQK